MVPPITAVAVAPIPQSWRIEPEPPPEPKVSFADVLLREVRSFEAGEAKVDGLVKKAMANAYSPGELLAMQVVVHRYSLQLELLSKALQQVVSGLRDVLRTQV
ncbi:MAG: hypothetical protein JNK82_45435 [Myxococcaceae bacterium]|nr:hypothetical protein [Myxococcaceae bacterium]